MDFELLLAIAVTVGSVATALALWNTTRENARIDRIIDRQIADARSIPWGQLREQAERIEQRRSQLANEIAQREVENMAAAMGGFVERDIRGHVGWMFRPDADADRKEFDALLSDHEGLALWRACLPVGDRAAACWGALADRLNELGCGRMEAVVRAVMAQANSSRQYSGGLIVRCSVCEGQGGRMEPPGSPRDCSQPFSYWVKCKTCFGFGASPLIEKQSPIVTIG